MNVYLMVDIEGISGVYTKAQVFVSEGRIAEGRKYMTDDINACMRGLKEAGVDKIYVQDCHGSGNTVNWSDISDDADYVISGEVRDKRFPGIEDCDAVILLGYHAMAGAHAAILEHSWSSMKIQNLWVNGEKAGEILMDAVIAGEYGKPIIMVSGDDKACSEAKAILPDTVTAEVKKGLSTFGGMLLPPAKAHKLIQEKAKEAVLAFEKIKPFSIPKPVEIQIELIERTLLPYENRHPGITHIDGRTFKITADTMEEALFKSMIF